MHKTGVSAAHISRVLGVAENTGLNWLRKLRCVTVNPEREPLCGEVEADTIFFNVQDENGKGIEVPVAVAIEVERNTDKWGREHAGRRERRNMRREWGLRAPWPRVPG